MYKVSYLKQQRDIIKVVHVHVCTEVNPAQSMCINRLTTATRRDCLNSKAVNFAFQKRNETFPYLRESISRHVCWNAVPVNTKAQVGTQEDLIPVKVRPPRCVWEWLRVELWCMWEIITDDGWLDLGLRLAQERWMDHRWRYKTAHTLTLPTWATTICNQTCQGLFTE